MARTARGFIAWTAAAAAVAGVFALYTRPDVAVMLAELMWACFN